MSNGEFISYDEIKIAYKKLKSSVYFDKTATITRNRLVEFEDDKFEDKLKKLYVCINGGGWEKYKEQLINEIKANVFPKKIEYTQDSNKGIIRNKKIISNKLKINSSDDLQYIIDMSIESQIIGVLWIMKIGYQIDKQFYEHSYGNRLIENKYNISNNWNPYLFKPYYNEYTTWRDNGLTIAEDLYNNKSNCLVLCQYLGHKKSNFFMLHF